MNNPFSQYLSLLEQIKSELEKLGELEQEKVTAVRHSDLLALDGIMKREQAMSLAFRGLEQKQATLLDSTGLAGQPLSAVPGLFPPKMRLEAKQAVENLQTQYQIYLRHAEVARNTLECNLHEIEKFIAAAGGTPDSGAGYQSAEPVLPGSMTTDFRA